MNFLTEVYIVITITGVSTAAFIVSVVLISNNYRLGVKRTRELYKDISLLYKTKSSCGQ